MRHKCTCLALGAIVLILPAAAPAQSLEAGFTVGNGQRGREGALIRTEARLVTGIQVGLLSDRLEAAIRVAWLDLPSTRSRATYYHGCQLDTDGRCRPTGSLDVITRGTSPRLFVSGQALYHFRRGRQWRPFAGIGFGAMRDTVERTCDRSDCLQLIPGLQSALGRRTAWHSDRFSPTAGVATTVGKRLTFRGGVQFHRPFGEDLSLFETFAGMGYRF